MHGDPGLPSNAEPDSLSPLLPSPSIGRGSVVSLNEPSRQANAIRSSPNSNVLKRIRSRFKENRRKLGYPVLDPDLWKKNGEKVPVIPVNPSHMGAVAAKKLPIVTRK